MSTTNQFFSICSGISGNPQRNQRKSTAESAEIRRGISGDQTDLTPYNNRNNQTPDDPSDTQNSTAHKNQQDRSDGTISETNKQLDSDNSVNEKDTDQQEVIIFEKEVYIDTEDENQKDDDYQVKYGAIRAIRTRV